MSEASASYLAALSFAVERHGAVRQTRKGTSFPYVVHPIRVAEILDRFGYSEDTVVAGLLHDTVEDAEVRYEELARRFGERVATLVEKASEHDKSLDWRPRKEHTIDRAADTQRLACSPQWSSRFDINERQLPRNPVIRLHEVRGVPEPL
jgi:(p)ppGpp synthase/HD superfamily hydrolase